MSFTKQAISKILVSGKTKLPINKQRLEIPGAANSLLPNLQYQHDYSPSKMVTTQRLRNLESPSKEIFFVRYSPDI
jgi:hypothetical protein